MMKKKLTLLLILCLLVTIAGGCSGDVAPVTSSPATTNTKSSPATGSTDEDVINLMWYSSRGTDSLIESPYTDSQGLHTNMIFDCLIKVQADGTTFSPKLAKSYSVSSDGLEYSFVLDTSAKWHNGEPFTADDVIFSLETMLKFPKAGKSGFAFVEGAQAVVDGKSSTISGVTVDGDRLTIKLTDPNNNFLYTLCGVYILPKHLLEGADVLTIDDYEPYWSKPIGTGPYYIDEVSYPNYFTVIRNDEYHLPVAGIKKAVFTSYQTGGKEAVVAALAIGNLDFVNGNDYNDINTAKNVIDMNDNIDMIQMPSAYTRWLGFGTNGPAVGEINSDILNPKIRQALSMLADKEAIASFYEGQSVPMTTFVPPSHPAFNKDIPEYQRDIEKARQILIEEGFDFEKSLRMLYYYNDQTSVDIAELLKQNYADAGVKLEPFLATGDLGAIIYDQRNWEILYMGGYSSDPIYNMISIVPLGDNYEKLFGQTEDRLPFKDIWYRYIATTIAAEKKAIGDEMQLMCAEKAYVDPIYSINKIILYNKARLHLPMEVFAADYENIWDLMFEKWSLLP